MLIVWLLFRTGFWQEDILCVRTMTVRFSVYTFKTSRFLSAGRYGVEELQSTLYHLLIEQFAPIPKGVPSAVLY
ncbi:hypothetical protein HanPI659440_Chr14g0547071 [Helianthus annuus]|nr:hypothetical protein HanPI659440_Chr14g0547071 [Helianthus annuus]